MQNTDTLKSKLTALADGFREVQSLTKKYTLNTMINTIQDLRYTPFVETTIPTGTGAADSVKVTREGNMVFVKGSAPLYPNTTVRTFGMPAGWTADKFYSGYAIIWNEAKSEYDYGTASISKGSNTVEIGYSKLADGGDAYFSFGYHTVEKRDYWKDFL